LADVLTAHDPDVRIRALEVLSANNTSEAVQAVRTALQDQDAEVVYNAVLSLIELEGEGSIVEISQLLDKTEDMEPVLRGLFHATNYLHLPLAEHPAIDVLLDSLARAVIDPAPEARGAVVWILAWMRHEHATDLLKYAYYHEENRVVKTHMLRVTLALMNSACDELLDDALSSDDPILVETAQSFSDQLSLTCFDNRAVAAAPLTRDELAWH
jgi:HEAT repeat protein